MTEKQHQPRISPATLAFGALAVGAAATGAAAIGALAIGILTIRRLKLVEGSIENIHIRRLTIGELCIEASRITRGAAAETPL